MQLYDFSDSRSLLKHFLNEAKNKDPLFSQSSFAKRIEVKPEFISDLLKGRKKFKVRYVSLFAEAMQLNKDEARYFKLLVKSENSQSEEERELYVELLQNEKNRHSELDETVFRDDDFLGNSLAFTLLNMPYMSKKLPLSDYKKVLKHKADAQEIYSAIEKAVELGFLKIEEDGTTTRLKKDVRSPRGEVIEASHKYYREVSDKAMQSLSVDISEREFQCFALPVSKRKLPQLKELFRSFRKELTHFCAHEGDEIYQVNLQLFPLTEIQGPRDQRSSPSRTTEAF